MYGLTLACPGSWLYTALSGPLHDALCRHTTHTSLMVNPARKGRRNAMSTHRSTASTMPPKVLYTVPQAMAALSLSRSKIYELIRAGRLRAVKEGRGRLVPATAITDYVALLEREAA